MKYERFLGLDPGKDCGLAVISGEGKLIEVREIHLPGDEKEIIKWVKAHGGRGTKVFIERPYSDGGNRGFLTFTRNCFMPEGIFITLRQEYQYVTASTWKRYLVPESGSDKKKSLAVYRKLFRRKTCPTHNAAEAALIAMWGRIYEIERKA